MNNHRKRRKRRQAKQALKYGKTAAPIHKLISGRTGSVHHKKIKNKGSRGAATGNDAVMLANPHCTTPL